MSEQERSQDANDDRDDAQQGEASGERTRQGGKAQQDRSAGDVDATSEDRAAGSDAPGSDAAAEIARLTDALARTQAEMVNQQRRLEREMDKSRKFALERVMRDFVPVLDSLDQAIEAAGTAGDSSDDEGLALTRKLALKALETHGLETIDPTGKPFDPSWHEAMTAVPSEDAEPDSVLQVLQKGYALHGRLLRPARVVVAKAP